MDPGTYSGRYTFPYRSIPGSQKISDTNVFRVAVISIVACIVFYFFVPFRHNRTPRFIINDGFGPETVKQFTGFYRTIRGGELWFWMFESRNDPSTDPFVIWLTGGPGSGSEVALFYENGPYNIDENDELVLNPHSWNSVANVMYIDQPVGTGLSEELGEDYCQDGECSADDLYEFLFYFFREYREYRMLPFYITGESYAGHYIPPLAYKIVSKPNNMNLQGISIGNGIMDMKLQYQMFFEFGMLHRIIREDRIDEAINLQLLCVNDNPCAPLWNILTKNGSRSLFDFTKSAALDDIMMSQLERFMNRFDVRKALNLNNFKRYQSTNSIVESNFDSDQPVSYHRFIEGVLQHSNIKIFIYAGMKDIICNHLGQRMWLSRLSWENQKEWNQMDLKDWEINGKRAGVRKQIGNLVYTEIDNAGHMVPKDQPEHALALFKQLIASAR